jgi:uncharacterized protein YjbI with pentapeptide repeats
MKKGNKNVKLSKIRSGGYVSMYSLKLNENSDLQPSFRKSFKKYNIIEDLQQDLRGWSAKYCDFSNSDFSCIYASLCNFQGSSFKNANLGSSDFTGANLRGCDFSGANLSLCDFRGADLTGANFDNAIMDLAIVGRIKRVVSSRYPRVFQAITKIDRLQPCENADLIVAAMDKVLKRLKKRAKITKNKTKKRA